MPLIKSRALLSLLIPLCVLSPLIAIMLGSADITLSEILFALLHGVTGLGEESLSTRIVLELRLPRVLLAMLCGAGLAVAGSVLQKVTRNPLADPYLFGLSSGATLGAVIAITIGISGLMLPAAAFCGALIAVGVVMVMARNGQVEKLILAGVAISFLLAAIANLILYFGDPHAIQAVLFWNMGSFARASWSDLALPTIILLAAMGLIHKMQRLLQALMAGDESAHTQGVAVGPLRLGMLLLAALITASLVANCGGIGFVGLMVPHIVRLLIGSVDEAVVPITAMTGALLMVWVDLLSRLLSPTQQLPVGVLTAILGSLFFIGLLFKRHRGRL